MLFSRFKNNAQVATFITLVIVIVILAIGATMLIGEVGFQKIRLANLSDAALISSATQLARSLNLVRQTHYRLLLNHLRIQVMLLARGVWITKGEAVAFAIGYVEGIKRGEQLYKQAREVVKDVPKDVSVNLYERILGAIVDEAKAYHYKDGKLDLEGYLKEDSNFTTVFRDFKKVNKDTWYKNSTLSYSWNKTAVCTSTDASGKCTNRALVLGTFSVGDPVLEKGGTKYDCYIKEQIVTPPENIGIKPQKMLFFFRWKCGHSVCPGFLPNPYAWINRITISPGSEFGTNIVKQPFKKFPYFVKEGQAKEISHSNKVRITGSIWSGYDVRMVQ